MQSSEAPRVDMFGIGAPKARTTWMAECLREHPEIAVARDKEPNFFVRRPSAWHDEPNASFLREWSWYRRQFEHAEDGQARVDLSVTLMTNPNTSPELVHRHYPDAKLLVLLRDPVKRAYSDYLHAWGRIRHQHPVPDTFEEALENPRFRMRSDYHRLLRPWFERFPRRRILVLSDLDFNETPNEAVQRVYEFLDADPRFEPDVLNHRVNAAKANRGYLDRGYRMGARLRRFGLGKLVDTAKRAGFEKLLQRVEEMPLDPPPIDPETEARLRRHYRPGIEELENELDRDLRPWKRSDDRPRPASPAAAARPRAQA